MIEEGHVEKSRKLIGLIVRRQYLGLGQRVTVMVEEFVLVDINYKNKEETPAVLRMEQVAEILYISYLTLFGDYTVADIIMPLLTEKGLSLYLVLYPVVIIRIDHTLKGTMGIIKKILERITAIELYHIGAGIQYPLISGQTFLFSYGQTTRSTQCNKTTSLV